jgi:soluble lytic murein transglycosylase
LQEPEGIIPSFGTGLSQTLPVRLPRRIRITFLSLLLAAISVAGAPPRASGITRQLQRLALHAKTRRGWSALRRYAHSTRNEEVRGLAFFVLGYREFGAGAFDAARNDLHFAANTHCSLADLALYYEALTDQRLNQPASGIEALQGFSDRFPESPFRLRAVILLADLLIANQQAKQTVQLLSGEAETQRNPQLLLSLAKAYEASGNTLESAKLYQRIYYFFPASPVAGAARSALDRLRLVMGPSYPEVSDQTKTERADTLSQSWQLGQAFRDFDDLLRSEPQSPLAGRWRLARARCLLRLGHYDAAAESLLSPMAAQPKLDPERLALLAHIYERADDQPSLLNIVDELYREAPRSESYAAALFFAGDHFSRHGFWQTALGYYQPLAANFPGSRWASQARWWLAWYEVLAGKDTDATAALENYLRVYPDSAHVPAAL